MTSAEQARIFAVMALCGACTGMLHDLLGILRKNHFAAAAADLALGVFCAGGVIAAALFLRCEAFRLYTLLGAGIGWAIYGATLGRIVRFLQKNFTKLSEKVTN